MTNLNNKWMITFGDEMWNTNYFGEFNSFEEAQQFVSEKGKQKLYSEWCEENNYTPDSGEVIVCTAGLLVRFSPYIDGEDVIDTVRDRAYDFGGEYAEDYLSGVKREVEQELSEQLTKVFNEWAIKHSQQPSFYNIHKTKEII
jgi:hypothetical protein